MLTLFSTTYVPPAENDKNGAQGVRLFNFVVSNVGEETVQFVYSKSWETKQCIQGDGTFSTKSA